MAEDNKKLFDAINNVLSKVDLSDVSAESSGSKDLPEGYYLSEVTAAELRTSKSSGNPMVALTLKTVSDGLANMADENGNAYLTEIKKKIGIVCQESKLDQSLSVYSNLINKAYLYGLKRKEAKAKVDEIIKIFDLGSIANRTLSTLSGGQKRRVDIARAIINDPEILILDEPTTGLDPYTRKLIWEIIDNFKNKGMTIFLTTHYMNEANDADYVVIIDGGKILAKGTPLDLKNEFACDYIYIYNIGDDEVKKLNKPYKEIAKGYKIMVKNTGEATDLIKEFPEIFRDYEILKGTMDDTFINVTGKKLGD